MIDIDAIARRLAAAEPAGLAWYVESDGYEASIRREETDGTRLRGTYVEIAETPQMSEDGDSPVAEFIAAAPSDIAVLLAALRERDATIAAATAEIERLASAVGHALGQAHNVVEMYRHLVMDTPKDQELHRKVTDTADEAIETALAVLQGRAVIDTQESL